MRTAKRPAAHARPRGGDEGGFPGGRGAATVALTAGAGIAALSLVAGSLVIAGRATDEPGCSGTAQRLSVLAAPEIGGLVRAAGEALKQRTSGCLLVDVTDQSPADAVTALATSVRKTGAGQSTGTGQSTGAGRSVGSAHDAGAGQSTGAGQSAGTTHGPQVWIPDSSVWTYSAVAAGVRLPAASPSVTLSPVVFAVSPGVAKGFGWPARPVAADRLLAATGATGSAGGAAGSAGEPRVRLGLPDPQRSAAAVGGVLAVERALSGRPGGRGALAEAVRSARTGLPPGFPPLLDAAAGGSAVAVPVSEQSVVAYNGRAGTTRVVAAYPAAGGMALDYPFVVLARAGRDRTAAARLLTALRAGEGADRLRAAGFRSASGSPGVSGPSGEPAGAGGHGPARHAMPGKADAGVDMADAVRRTVPARGDVDRAVRTLRLIQLRSRLLAVIDVSGSMGEPVAGTGKTRLDLTKDAAALGLAAYPDDVDVGLWVFSTSLAAGRDHRELVPIGPLGIRRDGQAGRSLLVTALGEVRDVPAGGTGLYDTTLAAVRAVREGWDPNRVNAVLLLTDGRNDDENSITLSQLLRTLRREQREGRPVPVISIAYGPGSDAAALDAISRTTGGVRYLAKDPREIQQVMLDAIGRRPCRPRCSGRR